MHDERRHIDLRQVAAEVGKPRVHARVAREGRRPGGDVETRLKSLVADPFWGELVGVVEVVEEVLEVGVAVLDDRRLDALEDLAVDALGVIVGLQQEGRDHPQQRGLAHASRAVAAEVASDLARAHRETHQQHIVQAQVLDQGVQVSGERVVVVAHRRLARAAEAAAVIADGPVAVGEQLALLPLP